MTHFPFVTPRILHSSVRDKRLKKEKKMEAHLLPFHIRLHANLLQFVDLQRLQKTLKENSALRRFFKKTILHLAGS